MKIRNSLLIAAMITVSGNAALTLLPPEPGATATLKFTLPEYSLDTININGELFSSINAEELPAVTEIKGEPELPYTADAIQLFGSGEVRCKINSIVYDSLPVLPVIPSKGMLTRDISPRSIPYEKNDIYNRDKYTPNLPVVIDSPYQIRNIRGVSAQVFPFSYNGATGNLRMVKEVIFSVYEESPNAARSANTVTEEFREIENRFINSHQSHMKRYTPLYDGDKMIIITPEKYREAAEKLEQWKNRKGIETDIYIYPTETGGTGHAAVKSFIQSQYDSRNISYVALLGDWEDIPSKMMDYYAQSKPADRSVSSDPSYTYLSGNDKYPDIFVGRFSVGSAQQANDVIAKTIQYEMYPEVGASWYRKAISIGSSEGTPPDYEWLRYDINPSLKQAGYTQIDEVYQGFGESTSDVSNYINEGRGLINFMGHGNYDGFGFSGRFWYKQSMIDALRNGNKLPVVVPLACNLGTFKGRTCAAESWLRNPNGGAVVIMASTPLMDWTPGQHAEVELAKLISQDAHHSMGAYFYNSEMKMLDIKRSSAYKTMNTWTYFGDPSLQFMSSSPKQLELTVDAAATIGRSTISVSGDNDVLVTLYSKELDIHQSKKISGGSASFEIETSREGLIYITGTARNFAPALDSIIVAGAEENVAPTDILISNDTIIEGILPGALVGILSTVDENINDVHSYEITTSPLFELRSDSVFTKADMDIGEESFTVTSSDQEGLSVTKEITVTIIENRFSNLMAQAEWSAAADTLGSSIDMSIDTLSGRARITTLFTRDDNPKYNKWSSLTGEFTGNLTANSEIAFSYSATDSMKLVFPMDELVDAGSGHYLLLPATGGIIKTVLFKLDELHQPTWVGKDTIPFDYREVHRISFELASEETPKESGTLVILSLGIDGYEEAVSISGSTTAIPSGLQVKSISNKAINLGIPVSGLYEVNIYSLNGRRLFSEQLNLSAGFQSISLNSSIGSGVKILSIRGAKEMLSEKVLLK